MAVELTVEPDTLDLRITGLDRLWCLSSGFRVSLADVEGARLVTWDEARADMSWRTMGGYVPGIAATGWYAVRDRPGARQFWAVFRDRDELLLVDTRVEKPCRIVLGHPDRARLAWWINERVSR